MHQMIRRHTISFKNAFSGINHAFKTQPNFRIHCLIAIAVIIISVELQISQSEWAVIALTIVWVLLTEMINTTVESMVDLITDEYHAQAKVAKDVAAGAVLLGAIGAIVIALIILLPKLIARGLWS